MKLLGPEAVPESVIGGIRNAGIEPHLLELPAPARADGASERAYVVVRKGVPERRSGTMEEILTVDKCNGALDWGLYRHFSPPRNDNPARALRQIGRGGSDVIIRARAPYSKSRMARTATDFRSCFPMHPSPSGV